MRGIVVMEQRHVVYHVRASLYHLHCVSNEKSNGDKKGKEFSIFNIANNVRNGPCLSANRKIDS